MFKAALSSKLLYPYLKNDSNYAIRPMAAKDKAGKAAFLCNSSSNSKQRNHVVEELENERRRTV